MKGYGVELHPRVADEMVTNALTDLHAEGYRDYMPQARPVFNALEELRTPLGQYHDINDIDAVRKVLNRIGQTPESRDAVRRAIGAIDDRMSTLTPRDAVINSQFVPRVVQEANEARSNYAAFICPGCGKRQETRDGGQTWKDSSNDI